MSPTFSRTLRSLQADQFGGSLLGIAVAVIGLVCWGVWFLVARVSLYEVSVRARIEVDREPHFLMSAVSGRVVRSDLVLGREVREGEILVQLDDGQVRYQLEEVRAQVGGLEAQLEKLRQELESKNLALTEATRAEASATEEARARHREALEAARFAEQEAERMKNLEEQGLVSDAEAEGRRTEARQKRQLAEAWSRALERLQGDRQAELAEKRAELEALERRAAELESDVHGRMAVEKRLAHELSLHVIRSPVVGRTGDVVSLKVGEVVSAKEHLGTVIPSGELRVVAEFAPQRALGRMRKGQKGKLRLDGFSWIEYGSVACTVQSVAREPQEGTVRVELSIDEPHSFPVPLDHGLPGSLEIEVEEITPAALVFRAAGRVASRPPQSQEH